MLQPGESIDVWVVEKAIGSGGMGSVYRCHNRHAPRILAAIKTLEGAVRRVPEAEARFVREAEILFSIDHPNVVKVRNVRLDFDHPFIEMEFVEGESLEARLCRGPLPLEEAIDVMAQLLDALVYLHERGIRHRDIKPANLLLNPEGRLKLVDFGLASEADVERITRANTTFGTVSYAPPEWIRPDELDPESWDIYASGVVFWELLTSRVAFPGSAGTDPRQQAVQIMALKQNHPPLDPGSSYRDDIRALIRDMTMAEHRSRPQSVREALYRLRALDRSLSTPMLTLPPDLPGGERSELDLQSKALTELARKHTPAPAAPPSVRRPTPTAPGPSTPMALMATGGAMAAGFFAVIVIVLGVAWLATGGGAPVGRDVDVVISGLPVGSEVGLRIGDQLPSVTQGFRYQFQAVPPGTLRVRWAVGPKCAIDGLGQPVECPGPSCPAWCATGATDRTIEEGAGAQLLDLTLQPPGARDVRVTSPSLGDRELVVVIGGLQGRGSGEVVVARVPPGAHPVRAETGVCPPEAAGCDITGSCPPGCSSWAGDLVVPAGEGAFSWNVPMRPPVGEAPKAPAVGAIVPVVAPTAAPRPSRAVTKADFARWLEKNADWQREAAVAAGKADANYLEDWKGTAFPGKGSDAAVSVSYAAASAYCGGRGGLAPVDAAPTAWDETDAAPMHELRSKGGRPAWRRSDGASSEAVKPAESNAFMGFRCAK